MKNKTHRTTTPRGKHLLTTVLWVTVIGLLAGNLLLLFGTVIDGGWSTAMQMALTVTAIILIIILRRRTRTGAIGNIAAWASQIRQGDFSARLQNKPDNNHGDLHALTDDVNRLAEWLESLAESKNRELLEQSARLKTQTNIIRLLYDISGALSDGVDDRHSNSDGDELLLRTIRPMAKALDARHIAFYRHDPTARSPVCIVAWDEDDGMKHRPAAEFAAADDCVTIPLGTNAGDECRIRFAAEKFPLPDAFNQLLYTLGNNIGIAMQRARLHEQSARLSRMRERTHIANELHDSLAQTIAGLRFQVRILDDLLHQQEEHAAWAQLEKVENMVEEANAELRSLIGYFHAPIAAGGVGAGIAAAVARFRADSDIPLYFQNEWDAADGANIPEHWRLEIVRIVQEALNNIRQHSRAKNARVLLSRDGDGNDDGDGNSDEKYSVLVEDDGVGGATFNPDKQSGAHIGLSVMAQRAQSIGAQLQLDGEHGEGTRILLSFCPPRDNSRPPTDAHPAD